MKYIFIFALIVLSSCVSGRLAIKSNSQAEKTGEVIRMPAASYIDIDSDPVGTDLSYKELVSILSEYKFNKIDQLLEYLSKHKPAYMSRYALVYDSRSLHESSKSHPRAIIYGDRANFIVTFNGHKDQSAYDMLEVVSFNKTKKKFEYREIQFNDLGELPDGLPYKISAIGGSEQKCLACHSNARPIWESYRIWPGAYGADDDQPIGKMGDTLAATVLGLVPKNDTRIGEWNKFVQAGLNQGRYKNLHPLQDSLVAPQLGKRPNTDLSVLLTKLNTERIGQILKEKTDPSFRFAFLYAASCFGKLVKENHRREFERKNYGGTESPLQIDPIIQRIALEEYGPRLDADSLTHQMYRADRIMTDVNIDYADLREQWREIYLRFSHWEQKFTWNESKPEFLRRLILAKKVPFLSEKIDPTYKALVGITDKFFPKSESRTWPSSLYENVHKYDTGILFEIDWLKTEVYKLLSADEQTRYHQAEQRDWISFCNELPKNFPSAIRGKAAN